MDRQWLESTEDRQLETSVLVICILVGRQVRHFETKTQTDSMIQKVMQGSAGHRFVLKVWSFNWSLQCSSGCNGLLDGVNISGHFASSNEEWVINEPV